MSTTTISAADLKRTVKGSYAAHEALQADILKACALHGVPAVAIHTGPRVRPREGGGFDLRQNRAQIGVSDVMACLPPLGQLALFEAKSGNARRKPGQIALQEKFAAAGALCLEVRSVVDILPYLTVARAAASARKSATPTRR